METRITTIEGKESLAGLISGAAGSETTTEAIHKEEHAAEAIKDPRDIQLMADHYRSKGQYRNLMYFVIGLHTGLRVSDMLRLRFCDLLNDDLTWRDEIVIEEKKTKNTKKRRSNRHIAIGGAIRDVVREYLTREAELDHEITLDTYLFRSESRNARGNVPLHRNKVDDFLKQAAKETGVAERVKVSTHTLRKSFGYRVLTMTGDITTLQKILCHSSPAVTLSYCGISRSDMERIYLDLNYDVSFSPREAALSGRESRIA